jgi:hypothetical protein
MSPGRVWVALVVTLLAGAGSGFAYGAHRSDDRADNCQHAAQQMYEAMNRPAPDNEMTQTVTAYTFTDDYCPIDQVRD